MNLPKIVAKLRFHYHANMLDVCNVLNQIGLLKDIKAEYVMKCVDCLERLGYDIGSLTKKEEA